MNDRQLTINDIGQLEDNGRIIHFFAHLGYQVDQSAPLDHALLGMDTADLRQQIRHIHYIGSEDADFGEIKIYLFEVRSVTVSLIQKMVRCFRDRLENPLLLLTSDYEQLDFVLIEKDLKPSRRLGLAFKQILQPHTLTVNRRNPGPVALRVLRRFTHTEADGLYQWEKLRSAFRLAQWGETYFNNRALFSDYTLNKRLTDPQLNPEWGEEHLPVARRIDKLMSGARSRFTAQPADVIDRDLYQPLWDQLGFAWQAGLPDRETAASLTYTLTDPDDPDQLLALVLATVWNRNLDDADPDRDQATPDEIPGARVVSLLEGGQAPWVIVTNGKLWRLYAAEASNKATNYYEVDLEEALAPLEGQTQDMAFKYWWLFFRRHAFTGFLERLRQQSADYAQELSNRLKGRVFEEIFPHFAEGFIQQIRVEANTLQAGFNDEALAWVYEGTLTFLYRLMFLLYAESLDLLPLNEAHGYRQISLERLKKEIAGQAGDIADEAPAKLRAHYSPTGTDLYQRLQTLFAAISQGNPAYNVPFYNGGLFSPDSESGEFLADHAIPNRYLALGLDRLCRDVDAKTQALAFIDFKSLGVRQLGSIYEGLLEFRLRIAAEPLAVVKEKNREVYLPAAKAGSKRPTATLEKGAVYLENDKRERKATGSYYTPDYIVKYIVTHTVGPVLEEKFTALRPRLTQAQRDYQSHAKLIRARAHENERPKKFWNSPAMQQLADDCLNVRVLDPAMGSGHFLVEVVDFLTNRLIDFLNGWSENPVWAMLEQIRGDILTEMERQGVTIDAERLTRVALLKRAILKRCIYGVDLNGMAVELAKVSLWLDAFTLGAPLSFLDHHLKQGNSLIGARIKEVEEAVEGTADKAVQLSLFSGGAFTGLSMATDLMRRVSYLSDNTAAQVAESQSTYEDARDHLAYYKRLLDVYTSRRKLSLIPPRWPKPLCKPPAPNASSIGS